MTIQQRQEAGSSAGERQRSGPAAQSRRGEPQSQRRGIGQRAGRQYRGLNKISDEQLARGLGWFSIGLGSAEVAAPRAIARLVGIRSDHRILIRTLGLREIASGIGILTQRTPAEGVWSRVGGDAIDLAVLGAAFTSPNAKMGRVAAATAAVVGVIVLDVVCAQLLSRNGRTAAAPFITRRASRFIVHPKTCTGSGMTLKISRAS